MPSLESFLADYGLLAVLIGTFFEGETIVIIAGFLSHQGYFSPYSLGICAFIGSFCGDQAWFYLGRRHADYRIVQKVTEFASFSKVIRLIEQHPIKFILTFRFIYGIRNISPVALGLSRVSAVKYLIFNAIAAAIWAAIFTTIGYMFGEAAEAFLGRLAGVQQKVLGAVIAGIIVFVLFRLAIKQWSKVTAARRTRAEADAAGE